MLTNMNSFFENILREADPQQNTAQATKQNTNQSTTQNQQATAQPVKPIIVVWNSICPFTPRGIECNKEMYKLSDSDYSSFIFAPASLASIYFNINPDAIAKSINPSNYVLTNIDIVTTWNLYRDLLIAKYPGRKIQFVIPAWLENEQDSKGESLKNHISNVNNQSLYEPVFIAYKDTVKVPANDTYKNSLAIITDIKNKKNDQEFKDLEAMCNDPSKISNQKIRLAHSAPNRPVKDVFNVFLKNQKFEKLDVVCSSNSSSISYFEYYKLIQSLSGSPILKYIMLLLADSYIHSTDFNIYGTTSITRLQKQSTVFKSFCAAFGINEDLKAAEVIADHGGYGLAVSAIKFAKDSLIKNDTTKSTSNTIKTGTVDVVIYNLVKHPIFPAFISELFYKDRIDYDFLKSNFETVIKKYK